MIEAVLEELNFPSAPRLKRRSTLITFTLEKLPSISSQVLYTPRRPLADWEPYQLGIVVAAHSSPTYGTLVPLWQGHLQGVVNHTRTPCRTEHTSTNTRRQQRSYTVWFGSNHTDMYGLGRSQWDLTLICPPSPVLTKDQAVGLTPEW